LISLSKFYCTKRHGAMQKLFIKKKENKKQEKEKELKK
jgi:hypothetical protein